MKDISGKAIIYYSIGAVIAAAIVRFFQYASIIDYSTGYFTEGSESAGLLIYILLVVFSLIFAVFAFLGKKKGDAAYSVASDGMDGYCLKLLGGSYILAGVIKVFGLFGGSIDIHWIFGAIGCAAFIGAGIMLLTSEGPKRLVGHLNIIAALMYFLAAANFFNSDLTILYRSDNLLTLFAYVTVTGFLASVSRFYASLEYKTSRIREVISAGLAFIFSGSTVIAKLAALLFGGSSTEGISGLNTDTAAGAVLALCFLITLFFTKKHKEMTLALTEEEREKLEKDKKQAENS